MATADSKNKDAVTDETKSDDAKTTDQKAQAETVPTGVTERSDADKADVPTSPEKKDPENDLAAQNEEEYEEVGEGVEGALGVVSERDNDGNEYEVPWLYLTADTVEATPARTSDWDDNQRSWTSQEVSAERKDDDGNDLDAVALVDVEATPGQVFRVRELPNREVAEAAGIDYAQWVTGLPVRPDVENEAPRRGTPA